MVFTPLLKAAEGLEEATATTTTSDSSSSRPSLFSACQAVQRASVGLKVLVDSQQSMANPGSTESAWQKVLEEQVRRISPAGLTGTRQRIFAFLRGM